MHPVESAGDSRRQAILDAALRVIAAGGIDIVTHRSVAAAARVPLGSLTYYFGSREDLLREAFRHYLATVREFLFALEREMPARSPAHLADYLLEITRREFADPAMVRAEYEMILYASRDAILAREFAEWEMGIEARLAASLEALGAVRSIDGARTIISVVRGFEIERLARPALASDNLRGRLLTIINALISPSSRGKLPDRRARNRSGVPARARSRDTKAKNPTATGARRSVQSKVR